MEDNDNDDAADDADDVNQMCENVYNWAAKCESPTGLESGFVQVNRDENDYENQVENEFMACTFINSLIWDSYTESGEINWEAKQDVSKYTPPHHCEVISHILVFYSSATCNLQAMVGLGASCRRFLGLVRCCSLRH